MSRGSEFDVAYLPIGSGGVGDHGRHPVKPDSIDRLNISKWERASDGQRRVHHDERVIGVHDLPDATVNLLGGERRVQVKKRVLELVPTPQALDAVQDRIVVLSGVVQVVSNEKVVHHSSPSPVVQGKREPS